MPHDQDAQPSAVTMSPQDIIIAVIGITGAGKTTFISRCMGEDVGIGHGLRSYTQDVAVHSFRHNGRMIRLIDTPGFDDTNKTDVVVLNNIAFWLSHAYRAKPKLLLSGVVYLHPVLETKMYGSSVKNLEMMKLLCGENTLSAIHLATTMWDCVSEDVGLRREQEMLSTEQFWNGLIRHGSVVHRHRNSEQSAFEIIDSIIASDTRVVLSIQRQMVDEGLLVDRTDAGRFLSSRVERERQNVRHRLARSDEELQENLRNQQTTAAEEVRERQNGYRQQLEDKARALEAMRRDMAQLREQKAQEFRQREEDFAREKREQEASAAELDRQVKELQAQRDAAVKQAEEATANRNRLEDTNLQLLLARDQAAITRIDEEIAERKRQEERIEQQRTQTVKKEHRFRNTLKVTMAEELIHGAFHVVGNVLAASCRVM